MVVLHVQGEVTNVEQTRTAVVPRQGSELLGGQGGGGIASGRDVRAEALHSGQ